MSRDYAHEEWIPWYTRATAGWMDLSLAARGVAVGLAMAMGRDGTEIPLGSRGLRGLARTLACPWEDLEPALQELLSPGPDGEPPRLVFDAERRVLRDPEAQARRRPTSTARVNASRSRKRAESSDDETHATVSSVSPPSETHATVSSDLISSDLISPEKIPEEIPSARPRARPDPSAAPPDWWGAVLATVNMQTGETLAAGEAWLRYAGHRSGKGYQATRDDALYWLTSVMVPLARKERQETARQRERDAKYDRQRAGPIPPTEPRTLTEDEQRELAARVPMRRRDRGAA